MYNLSDKTILITGGTGSLANALIPRFLALGVRSVRLLSRGEHAQEEMHRRLIGVEDRLRFFIGDVRDQERVMTATVGCDVVIHAAALKIVPACAYNPWEAELTNIQGTKNVSAACFFNQVDRAVFISTDKAVEPVTLYGCTKAAAESLWLHANNMKGWRDTLFSAVRYGNVVGSKGSVLPMFLKQRKTGKLSVTDKNMTRFWLSMNGAVDCVIRAITDTRGGEVFVKQAPTMSIMALVAAIAPDCEVVEIGRRAQEKISEVLVTYEEARRTAEDKEGGYYIIEPEEPMWGRTITNDYPLVPEGFRYTSHKNPWRVNREDYIADALEYERLHHE